MEHAGDDVRRHRFDLGVVDPDVRVVEATAGGDPVLGLGELPLQLEEVLVALQIGIGLDAHDQVPHRAGELCLHVSTLLARQMPRRTGRAAAPGCAAG